MWMKMTRATLTPYNEYNVSLKPHCTNTDLKHAYLPQAAKMNFRKPDFHAHWWSHREAPICLQQPGCESPPPPPSPHTMSKLRTHLMIRELIRKRWQWGFTTLNFHQTISTLPFATQSTARDTGFLWRRRRRRRSEGLLPLFQASKGQNNTTL